jgi:hypothetical protein
MYNQVIFYNPFGAGDIFESREFVRAWMKLVPSLQYSYSHGKHSNILTDIPELVGKEYTVHMDSMRGTWDDGNGNLYVNTWIGRNGCYVLPGIGCTVEKLYDMHNDMLATYNLGILPGTPVDYIPDIDYSKYRVKEVDKFIKKHPEEKIFIDNGMVQSNQAQNFDMTGVVYKVAEQYPDRCFITSQHVPFELPNVFHTCQVIKSDGWGFDLNELSYVSTFCSTLIGRNSGPHVYTQVKVNCMNPNIKLLSFTYEQQGSSFVVNTPVPIQKFWSNVTDEASVISKIGEVLG